MPNFISCLTCTSYDGRLKIIKHLPDPSSGLQWIHGWPLCFLQICIFVNSNRKPGNSLLFFTCSHQCQHHLLSTGSAQCALTPSCSSCVFFGTCMFWAAFIQAPSATSGVSVGKLKGQSKHLPLRSFYSSTSGTILVFDPEWQPPPSPYCQVTWSSASEG